MFFVVDRPRLQRIIAITRDDRRPKQQGRHGPFFRIEANGDKLKLTGRNVEAEFPATVYEPGVLFLRVTVFRRLLQALTGTKELAIQVNGEGLFADNVRLSPDVGDMLLYVDPAKAPALHPDESCGSAYPEYDGKTLKGTLFEDLPPRRRDDQPENRT